MFVCLHFIKSISSFPKPLKKCPNSDSYHPQPHPSTARCHSPPSSPCSHFHLKKKIIVIKPLEQGILNVHVQRRIWWENILAKVTGICYLPGRRSPPLANHKMCTFKYDFHVKIMLQTSQVFLYLFVCSHPSSFPSLLNVAQHFSIWNKSKLY